MASCGRSNKIIISPIVAWPCDNGCDGARLHYVVVFFVCLHVLIKFHLAMSVAVQFAVEYDFRLALCLGHTAI